MWRNPKYHDAIAQPDAPAEAPRETGRRLATLPRDRRDAPPEELRVSLDTYEGHAYISVRLWQADRSGQWWPVKGKGVSIRLREAEDVADALKAAVRINDAARGPASGGGKGGQSAPRGRGPARRDDLPPVPEARGGPAFDEFQDAG